MKTKRLGFRILSLLLSFLIAYQNVLWAADARQLLKEAKYHFDVMGEGRPVLPGGSPAPAGAPAPDELNQNAVAQQNLLQDLGNLNFQLMTANGDIISLLGGEIQSITQGGPDGATLTGVVIDPVSGNIIGADLVTFADGAELLNNGQTIKLTKPDGSIILFNLDGTVQKITTRDHVEINFRSLDAGEREADSVTYSAIYDVQGELKQVFNKQTRITIAYQEGMIKSIEKENSFKVVYRFADVDGDKQVTIESVVNWPLMGDRNLDGIVNRADMAGFQLGKTNGSWFDGDFTGDGKVGLPDLMKIQQNFETSLPVDVVPLKLLYDENKKLKEVSLNDWTNLKFSDGNLVQSTDAEGNAITFDFERSVLSNVVGSTLTQGSFHSKYDSQGRLTLLTMPDGTILHYDPETTLLVLIERTDNTRVYSPEFGIDGASGESVLVNGEVHNAQGIFFFEQKELVRHVSQQNGQYDFLDGKVVKLVTPENLEYTFDYVSTPGSIIANLEGVDTPDALTPIRMEYDLQFNLQKIIRENEDIISFLDTETILQRGEMKTRFDEFHNPVESTIDATEPNGPTYRVAYLQGKIRGVYKRTFENGAYGDEVLVLDYTSYTYAGDIETIVIKDFEADSVKVYKNGNLDNEHDNQTNVDSIYSYDAAGKVNQVIVKRFGRVLHTYTYSYSGNLTSVTDELGVKRTYGDAQLFRAVLTETEVMDENGESFTTSLIPTGEVPAGTRPDRLLFLEKDNTKYRYAYHINEIHYLNGTVETSEEIVTEELIERTLAGGAVAYYSQVSGKKGEIDRIEIPDGSRITDIVRDGQGLFQQATVHLASGVRQIFNADQVLEEIQTDGTHFFFDRNGLITRVISPVQGELIYSYEKNADGTVAVIWVEQKDSGYRFKYDKDGKLLGVKVLEVLSAEQASSMAQIGEGDEAAFDGNLNTSIFGTIGENLYAETFFPSPQTVTQIAYRVELEASSSGGTDNGTETRYFAQVQVAGSEEWIYVTDPTCSWSPGNGCYGKQDAGGGGGNTHQHPQSGNPTVINVNIANVTAVRMFAAAGGYSNDGGPRPTGWSQIYELQYTLSDQSYYAANQTFDAEGHLERVVINGAAGEAVYNAEGQLLSSTVPMPASLGAHLALADFSPQAHGVRKSSLPALVTSADAVGNGNIRFDGTDDFLKVSEARNFFWTQNEVTIDFWIKPTVLRNYMSIFSQSNNKTTITCKN